MLRTTLGPAIARYLEDTSVVEVRLNPDGRIWVDRLREGLVATGDALIPADGELLEIERKARNSRNEVGSCNASP